MVVQDYGGSLQNATTLRGRVIECMYTVKVRAEMDNYCMCCGQAPTITREVTVYPVQLPVEEMAHAPVDWSPTVMLWCSSLWIARKQIATVTQTSLCM